MHWVVQPSLHSTLKQFNPTQNETIPINIHSSFHLNPTPTYITKQLPICLSVSMEFPTLGISYKWNQAI